MGGKVKQRDIAILSGSYAEYRYFCFDQGWAPYPNMVVQNGVRIRAIYCGDTQQMRGWMPDEFIRTGTWYRQRQELIDEFEIFRQITEAKRGSIERERGEDDDNGTVGC